MIFEKNDPDHREDWLRFAKEFARRGLWPIDEIEVHGPHHPRDYMWGVVECIDYRSSVRATPIVRSIQYRTRQGSGRALQGLTVWEGEGADRVTFGLLSEIPETIRERLRTGLP